MKPVFLSGLFFIFLSVVACSESRIEEEAGKKIALDALSDPQMTTILSGYNVNVDKLPAPTFEYQGNKLLVDFKDNPQNIWIVIIILPDRTFEVSYTKIKE